MKWQIAENLVSSIKNQGIVETILKNRGIKNINEFLNPPNPLILNTKFNTAKAKQIIEKSIKLGEKIVVYGDYDVDGICATAIIWEALHKIGAGALPFIPRRENEGYGLSIAGIDNVDAKVIIAVDSGIAAHEAIDYAHSKGIKVIVLDHHEKPKKLPKADAIIHNTKLCSAGIAYFFAQHGLELAAIATVCDMVPLTGTNRSIVKYGLEELNKTTRPGLKALYDMAGIKNVGVYEIGFMIGPRLNAAGRIDSALTSLRLLCTHNPKKAQEFARQLNGINKERQNMVEKTLLDSKFQIQDSKIIVIDDESYHQGIIGLIASKLTEKHYLPSIVISRGEEISKASARSIAGFNIIEAIRTTEKLLINAGGHPMAAGFTIKTSEISNFKFQISNYARDKIKDDLLEKSLRVDCKLNLSEINMDLYHNLLHLEPYGLGNPQPIFCSDGIISDVRALSVGKHLKLKINNFDAIGFNLGYLFPQLKPGQKISLAYTLDLNTFNGQTTLQLKIRDIKLSS